MQPRMRTGVRNLGSARRRVPPSGLAACGTGELGSGIAWAPCTDRHMKRALLVDDEPCVLRAVKLLAGLEGYDPVLARCASEALAADGVFDLGILDIELGGECGIELAQILLEEGRVRQVLFYSGCQSPERIARAQSVSRVILKGDLPEHLIQGMRDSGAPRAVKSASGVWPKQSAPMPTSPPGRLGLAG